MADLENRPDPEGSDEPVGEELGDPITELAELSEEAPQGFLGRVLDSVRRRRLTAQVATFSWSGLALVFTELLKLVHGLIEGLSDDHGGTGS